jgi:antitoxin YxxD
MLNFNFLKKYIVDVKDVSISGKGNKFEFFKINEDKIINAEEKIKMKFPEELRNFYLEIGPGFLTSSSTKINRIMGPGNIAEFILEEGMYEGTSFCADYNSDKSKIVFFEAFEEVFFSIEMNGKDKNPVYFTDLKLSDSLEEFLHKMDEDNNFYEALIDNI